MATTKEFLNSFLKSANSIPDIAYRAMMGEYVLYYKQKVIGGIYDNRVLIKPVNGLETLMPNAELQIPYKGAKPLVKVECFDGEFLLRVFELLYANLPMPKPKKRKSK